MTLLAGLALIALLTYLSWRPLMAYLRYRGDRLITCPENQLPAAVVVDARQAALTANVAGVPHRLRACSRWPEMGDCPQDCLCQVEADPEATRVTNIVSGWYEGKRCALCDEPIEMLTWSDRRAAVLDPVGVTQEWNAMRSEDLPQIFATHKPVCWNCHLAATFRGRYSELVTDRLEH